MNSPYPLWLIAFLSPFLHLMMLSTNPSSNSAYSGGSNGSSYSSSGGWSGGGSHK